MRNTWLRVIPSNPNWVPSADRAAAATALLRSLTPDAGVIQPVTHAAVVFVDARTCGNVNLPLEVLLHHLNPVLRGWCAYFRPDVSSAAFQYLGVREVSLVTLPARTR